MGSPYFAIDGFDYFCLDLIVFSGVTLYLLRVALGYLEDWTM
jgi:hypothetical protein